MSLHPGDFFAFVHCETPMRAFSRGREDRKDSFYILVFKPAGRARTCRADRHEKTEKEGSETASMTIF